jgi:hypothetical protein
MTDDIFPRIAHWLNDQPDELSYENLKKFLLEEFTLKPAERAQKVLALASQPVGDMSARQAWYEMQALLTLPSSIPGSSKKVDLERELWLQRLPDNVRATLPGAEDTPMDALIEMADAFIVAGRATVRARRPVVSDVEDTNALAARRSSRPFRKPAERQRKANAYLLPSGLCNYHAKWGDAARDCIDGCIWQKNGPSGR